MKLGLPRFVAYNEPNMPPRDPVRYRAPKALPRLLAYTPSSLVKSCGSVIVGLQHFEAQPNEHKVSYVVLRSMAQQSTAQHSTAQHSTAQHSTAHAMQQTSM